MDHSLLKRILRMAYPNKTSILEKPEAVLKVFAIGSYAPTGPVIPAAATLACIGSCFAQELAKSLAAQGRKVAPIWLSERWNTAFALRHFVEHALEGTPFPPGYLDHVDTSQENLEFNAKLTDAQAFVLTFGLSVCWQHRETGQRLLEIAKGYGPKGVAAAIDAYEMRQTSVEENVEAIRGVIACIRRQKPDAPICITLSPIPLLVSATDYPPIASNAISKATLRVAIHQTMRLNIPHVYYWPSYEIVEWLGRHKGPIWGTEDGDLRHVDTKVTAAIAAMFSEAFIAPPP